MSTCKVLVFSDVHFHQWQEHERDERWRDCLKAVQDVRLAALHYSPDLVVFNGDLFESKRLLRSDIVAAAFKEMAKPWAVRDTSTGNLRAIPAVYVAGNHDYYKQACVLDPLDNPAMRITVVHRFKKYQPYLSVGGHLFAFMPYGVASLPTPVDGDVSAVFTHTDIAGARISKHLAKLTQQDGVDSELLDTDVPCIINGHYHGPHTVTRKNGTRVYMVGSLLQHSWADADMPEDRGATLFTFTDTGCAEPVRIPIGNNYPRFYRDAASPHAAGDFVLAPKLADISAATTHTHEGSATIASGTSAQIILGYLKKERPGIKGKDLAEYYRTGLECLATSKGDTDAT